MLSDTGSLDFCKGDLTSAMPALLCNLIFNVTLGTICTIRILYLSRPYNAQGFSINFDKTESSLAMRASSFLEKIINTRDDSKNNNEHYQDHYCQTIRRIGFSTFLCIQKNWRKCH